VESLTMYEAVRLFIDRAVSAQHTFTATSQNTPAIAQICFRLDGIPLALELAAARVKSLSVEQIARRLDDSFRLLNGGDRTRLPRQQTLRALVDWSHDLLSEPERIMWRRMAIFAGNFTLEAVEAVCSGDGVEEFEVLDLLVQLVDKSLVVSEERDGESRYRLLEAMRQYGDEKLAQADEREVVLARHCDHYLKVVEQAAAGLRSPHMQAAHISVWVREIDNLRIAMDWSQERAVADSGILDKAGRLISASQWLWPMSGLTREGYDRLRAWIALPSETALTKTRANALNVAAILSGI
jgi:predicted ATPase